MSGTALDLTDAPHTDRAVTPVTSGRAEADGLSVWYETFGEGDETVLLMPTWAIVHSRFWKAQVPFLSRHFRVVTFDPLGNGRSDRPKRCEDYDDLTGAELALAVLDAARVDRCVVVTHCAGAPSTLVLATDQPERIAGTIFIGPALGLTPPRPDRAGIDFEAEPASPEGWHKRNRRYWRTPGGYRDYVEYHVDRCFTEPHSTKQIEDAIGWGLETTPEILALTIDAPTLDPAFELERLRRLECPLMVIQGDEDALIPADRGPAFAAATGAELVMLEGVGHCPNARQPVRFNRLVHDFTARAFRRPPPRPPWRRAATRTRSALMISSPIGLGHAWRDVAIARELRRLVPELQIDWLAQEPVTRVLEACGETVHPASRQLAKESRHIAAAALGHELNVFEAWRRMDEILVSNFMVFDDLVRVRPYDLWIGDEAWELDYYLHENPELKNTSYCFITDFVGWLPMPEGGEREAMLTADYNAEMILQVERFPRIRDRALFMGAPQDIAAGSFGPGLPEIRAWAEAHFDFCGYPLAPGAGPVGAAEARELRAGLGIGPDEPLCVVSVGGSGVGSDLLRLLIEALPEARRLVAGLRMVAVCGPGIEPTSLPQSDGLHVLAYVHRLDRLLAACDIAVVQGGLTTSMELAAAGRPFLSFPLAHHFEQRIHVRHRLDRYGAGRMMEFEAQTPESVARAIAEEMVRRPTAAPVAADGAAHAARRIAELL